MRQFSSIHLQNFYVTVSASINHNPVGVKISDLSFHTDKTNAQLKFHQAQGFKSKPPDVFKFINLMHDIEVNQSEAAQDEMEDSRKEFKKLRSKEMLKSIYKSQTESLTELRKSEKVFDASVSEVGLLFRFMKEFSGVRNQFFKNVLSEVENM